MMKKLNLILAFVFACPTVWAGASDSGHSMPVPTEINMKDALAAILNSALVADQSLANVPQNFNSNPLNSPSFDAKTMKAISKYIQKPHQSTFNEYSLVFHAGNEVSVCAGQPAFWNELIHELHMYPRIIGSDQILNAAEPAILNGNAAGCIGLSSLALLLCDSADKEN